VASNCIIIVNLRQCLSEFLEGNSFRNCSAQSSDGCHDTGISFFISFEYSGDGWNLTTDVSNAKLVQCDVW
jgi:hypothetical protein